MEPQDEISPQFTERKFIVLKLCEFCGVV